MANKSETSAAGLLGSSGAGSVESGGMADQALDGTECNDRERSLALALSTALGKAQLAVFDQGGTLVFELEIAQYQEQSERLLGMLSEKLRQHGLAGTHIGAISINAGPGGFTSLRTACGVGQGLATAWGARCLVLNSFDLVFQAAIDAQMIAEESLIQRDSIAVVLDARLGELYCAFADSNAGCNRLEQADGAGIQHGANRSRGVRWHEMKLLDQKSESLQANLAHCELILTDSIQVAQLFEQTGLGGRVKVQNVLPQNLIGPTLRAWQTAPTFDPLVFQPLYIREKVAETTEERLARKHGEV